MKEGVLHLEKINERVKLLRISLNKSQEDFGNSIGLSKSGISNIENGFRNVTKKHIKLLCSTFHVSENWLNTGEGNMFNFASQEEEIGSYLTDILCNEKKSTANLIKSIILAYGKLDTESKNVIDNFIDKIIKNAKKE